MRAPLTWLRDFADLPDDLVGRQLSESLIRAGLEVETVEQAGTDISGPLVIGRVLEFESEKHSNGKTIRYCRVDVGEHNDPEGSRGIVCGADNFAVDDLVVVALPGTILPGDFAIAARKTYGHVSDGMICSAGELNLGDDHGGIMVLPDPDLVAGQDAADVLLLRDDVLDIAVTPDRGYCLSIRGLARESAQATGTTFTDPVDLTLPVESEDGHPVRLESGGAALFVALTVRNVDPSQPSPRWLARRVQLAGMRPISLAVDITNYVMLETGQPLHAYDAERLDGPIVVRQANVGEKLITLDDVVRDLDPADLVITDNRGPIGLAGVMGGESTELSDSTTSIVIEAANFDAMTVARTSRRHKLSSEASRRFERGVDPGAAYAAAHRAAALLAELAGGSIDTGETVQGTVPVPPEQVIAGDLPARILGTPVASDQAAQLLQSIGVDVGVEGDQLRLLPPTWRPDLLDPYDYVEEVGRLVGYDTIEPVVPRAPVGRGLTASQRARRMINSALADAGFVEVLSFPFQSEGELDQLGVEAGDTRRSLVRLANPLSDTHPFLRTTLLPGLFGAVQKNTSRSAEDIAVYEAGAVFYGRAEHEVAPRPSVERRPTDAELAALDRALADQPRHLAVVLSGNWMPKGWQGAAVAAGWQHAVAFAETAARAVGLDLDRRPAEVAPWHPGRCAELIINDQVIGFAGELHPEVCRTFGLPARSCAAELDLDALVAAAPGAGDVAAISSFPLAKEDVALVVDASVSAAEVEAALRSGAGDLLESVRLFDIYVGPQIGDGKKSLAFALRFRAPDRTLTDADAATARDAAVAAAVDAVGAVQRV